MTFDGGETPPRRGRFVKGVSGNLRGRPRKVKPASQEENILRRDVQVTFQGEPISVKPTLAVMLALLSLADESPGHAEEFVNQLEKFGRFGAGPPRTEKFVTRISRSVTDWVLYDLDVCKAPDGENCVDLWIIREAIKHSPSFNLAGLDRVKLLAPFVNKVAAEKLLLPHGLMPER